MCNCQNTVGKIGAIIDCVCSDCSAGTTPAPIPGSTGSTAPASTINIYNEFSPLNFDSPIYVYPDGTYSNIPPGSGTLPGEENGTTIPPPPPTGTGEDIPTTVDKMFPWFLLLALGYAGYQVLKPGKKQRSKRRARA